MCRLLEKRAVATDREERGVRGVASAWCMDDVAVASSSLRNPAINPCTPPFHPSAAPCDPTMHARVMHAHGLTFDARRLPRRAAPLCVPPFEQRGLATVPTVPFACAATHRHR